MTTHPTALLWPPALADDEQPTTPTSIASTGRYVVTTASSTRYLIDLDGARATRFPGRADSTDWTVAELFGDGRERALLSVLGAIGTPMVMALALGARGLPTLRRTTPILTIEPLDLSAGWPSQVAGTCDD